MQENARTGSNRRAPSTIVTPDTIAPLESRRQRRALSGPKGFAYAVTSTVKDASADKVQVLRPAGKRGHRTTRQPRQHRDAPGRFTLNVGGSTPVEYVYGTG